MFIFYTCFFIIIYSRGYNEDKQGIKDKPLTLHANPFSVLSEKPPTSYADGPDYDHDSAKAAAKDIADITSGVYSED